VFFYLICTVVTIDTIGAVASNGAHGGGRGDDQSPA
jgi:hypothetical protein